MLRYTPGLTIRGNVGAAGAVSVNLTAGVMYRVVADVDAWVQVEGQTAAANVGMYLPAKVESHHVFSFFVYSNTNTPLTASPNVDPNNNFGPPFQSLQSGQITPAVVSVYLSAAGNVYFTPLIPVAGA
jgi:hypothetical protein